MIISYHRYPCYIVFRPDEPTRSINAFLSRMRRMTPTERAADLLKRARMERA